MVWTWAEERWWIYWMKNVDYGAQRRFMDVVKEDMVAEENARVRVR